MAFLVRENLFAVEEERRTHAIREMQLDNRVDAVLDQSHLDGFNLVVAVLVVEDLVVEGLVVEGLVVEGLVVEDLVVVEVSC